jgi:hypothetical protein
MAVPLLLDSNILACVVRPEVDVGGQVVTMNEKHFRDLVDVFDWRS